MKKTSPLQDKKAVLAAFQKDCPAPTPAQIAAWSKKYPNFAQDIKKAAHMMAITARAKPKRNPSRAEIEQATREAIYLANKLDFERSKTNQGTFSTYGARVKLAREGLGLTIDDMAKHLSQYSADQLQEIEDGNKPPRWGVLPALAEALNVSMAYLLEACTMQIANQWQRNGGSLSEVQLKHLEVEAIDFTQRYLEAETEAGEESIDLDDPASPLAPIAMDSLDAAEAAAKALRDRWDLGNEPIKSLTSLLESKGVKIMLTDLSPGHGFALRINEDGMPKTGLIIIGSGKDWQVPRQRFTLAHELAHLLDGKASETIANRFASAFLLPKAIMETRFSKGNKITIEHLIDLKNEFGISVQSIAMRFLELEFIEEDEKSRLMKDGDDRKGQSAALDGFDETPRQFEKLVLHRVS